MAKRCSSLIVLLDHRNCGRTTDSAGRKRAGSRASWPARSLSCARNGEGFMAVNEQEFAQAQKRMRARPRTGYVVAVRYNPRTSRIVVRLNTGLELAFPPSLTEGLAGASP